MRVRELAVALQYVPGHNTETLGCSAELPKYDKGVGAYSYRKTNAYYAAVHADLQSAAVDTSGYFNDSS